MTTNYERIKAMSIKEMTEFIDDWFSCSFCEYILNCRDSFYPSCIDYCVEKRPKKNKTMAAGRKRGMMTEKIIIDGVDVSECEHLYSSWPGSLPKCLCGIYDNPYNPENDNVWHDCKGHKNCYYKQLARKTEECEKLKNEIIKGGETLSDKVRAEVFTDLQKENDRYKQALEEIKTITSECFSKDICFDCKYHDECEVSEADIPTFDICKPILKKCEVLDDK